MKPKPKPGESDAASKESGAPSDDRRLGGPHLEPPLEQRHTEREKVGFSPFADGTLSPSRGGLRLLVVLLLVAILLPQALLWYAFEQLHQEKRKEHLFWTLCHGTATREGRAGAFFELLERGNTEWRSARLHDLNLSDAELQGAQLEWASLERSDLSRSELVDASLNGSSLRLSTLENVDLSGAKLRGAQCDGAAMAYSALRGTDLRGASLSGATLVGCDLSGADLTSADLRHAKLTGAILSGASLRGARLDLTDFTGARLEKVDLSEANWWRTRGLPQAAIDRFQAQFPPSAQAQPTLRADYQEWIRRAPGQPQGE